MAMAPSMQRAVFSGVTIYREPAASPFNEDLRGICRDKLRLRLVGTGGGSALADVRIANGVIVGVGDLEDLKHSLRTGIPAGTLKVYRDEDRSNWIRYAYLNDGLLISSESIVVNLETRRGNCPYGRGDRWNGEADFTVWEGPGGSLGVYGRISVVQDKRVHLVLSHEGESSLVETTLVCDENNRLSTSRRRYSYIGDLMIS